MPFELLPATKAKAARVARRLVRAIGVRLAMLRRAAKSATPTLRALAVSASPAERAGTWCRASRPSLASVYDLDPTQLRPLPSADDEARSVGDHSRPGRNNGAARGGSNGVELKRLPLADYQVLHFAVHGMPSTKFPARAALLVHPQRPTTECCRPARF